MWPFARRRSRVVTQIDTRIPSLLTGFDFSHNDAVIKLWLSEPLLDAIDLLCDTHDASRPDVLRWILFEHAYGRIEFAHLLRTRANPTPEIHTPVRTIATRANPPELRFGKATEDFKLHLPGALKEELQRLADTHARPLSDYVRGVLHPTLFGAATVRRSNPRLSPAPSPSIAVQRHAA